MWLNDRELEEYWKMERKLSQCHDKDDNDVFEFIALFIIVLVWTLAIGKGISS